MTSVPPKTRVLKSWRGRLAFLLPLLLCLASGCASMPSVEGFTPPWKKSTTSKHEPPKEALSVTGRGLIHEPIDPKSREELDAAQALFKDKKYAEAEKRFHAIAQRDTANWWELGFLSPDDGGLSIFSASSRNGKGRMLKAVYEEAVFFEAECQRLQKNYRDAEETYTKLLTDVPKSRYSQEACKGLFEIANHWLMPTREQMKEYQEQLEGKRWMVTPASYFHFSQEMPWVDAEGRATNALNMVRWHDINGPMGEKALFYLGTINFFRKEYKEADYYFIQLYQHYPNSEHAAKAVKQSVICKQLMTGGTVYDLRTVEESKKLLMTAYGAYPEFAKDENPAWVENQLKSINLQQADRDFRIAEFYERTGHPGSAYFYYELVCRRYPGTMKAAEATRRKVELKGHADREQREQGRGPFVPMTDAIPSVQPGVPVLPSVAPPPGVLPPGLTR